MTWSAKRFLQQRWALMIVLGVMCAALGGWMRWQAQHRDPHPVGDPDPGGRIMAQLTPTLDAIPASVHQFNRQTVPPVWSACDGMRSTFGWTDPAVVTEFDQVKTANQVIDPLDAGLRAKGWKLRKDISHDGTWYWEKQLAGGKLATVRLLGSLNPKPADRWDFQASSSAATHPVKGC